MVFISFYSCRASVGLVQEILSSYEVQTNLAGLFLHFHSGICKNKEKKEKEPIVAEAAGLTTVGENCKDTKTPKDATDSIKKNLDSQSTATTARGLRCASTMVVLI